MRPKNYYMILGIDEEASPSGIRGAFLDLAKRYHPDRVGPEGTRRFQEITEAYEHLSNPELRRQYDDSLRHAHATSVRRPEPEPLIPHPRSLFDQPDLVAPSSATERLLRSFGATGVPEREPPKALNLEVILSPQEAAFGIQAPIRLPVSRRCPRCDGTGQDWLFPCRYCLATGFIEDQRIFRVRIPPMVRDRSIMEIRLENLGVNNLFLRLHIRVQ